MNILIILALLLPRSEAAQESDEGEARRLLFRRSELLGRRSAKIIIIFIRLELEVYIQNTSEKMRVSARKCMN